MHPLSPIRADMRSCSKNVGTDQIGSPVRSLKDDMVPSRRSIGGRMIFDFYTAACFAGENGKAIDDLAEMDHRKTLRGQALIRTPKKRHLVKK